MSWFSRSPSPPVPPQAMPQMAAPPVANPGFFSRAPPQAMPQMAAPPQAMPQMAAPPVAILVGLVVLHRQ